MCLTCLKTLLIFFSCALAVWTASRRSTLMTEQVNLGYIFFVFMFMVCQFNRIFFPAMGCLLLFSPALGRNKFDTQTIARPSVRGVSGLEMANLRITLTVYFMTKIMALSFHNALEAHYYNRENCAQCKCKIRSLQMDYVSYMWNCERCVCHGRNLQKFRIKLCSFFVLIVW